MLHFVYQTLCKKGHAQLAGNDKKWKPDLFLNFRCRRSVSTSGGHSHCWIQTLLVSMVCTVSAGQNFCPWCSGREKVVGDDNDLSNLRESCGDVLKLQRRAEFAGNR